MIHDLSYKKAFYYALGLHLGLVLLLLTDSTIKRPVLTKETQNTPGIEQPLITASAPQEVVKAVSVDNRAITEEVNRLKQERQQKQQAETRRQQELQRQAQAAQQQRVKEQQRVAQLKEEANKIAIMRKKQAEVEKKRLEQLAEQKAKEAQRIEELKKKKEELLQQQAEEEKKLIELNKKKAQEHAKAEKLKAEKAAMEKLRADKAAAQAKADLERKRQADAAAAQRAAAAQNAERQALIAGEVDKYKALIVNAIGRNWILPENVDSSLTSKFRIRLGADGTVLDVALIVSSGDPLLDRSAQNAIYKASPLPVPSDADTFNLFRDISLTVSPKQVRG